MLPGSVYFSNEMLEFWARYQNTIKYSLIGLTVVLMIVAVQIYLNNYSILEQIDQYQIDIEKVDLENAYLQDLYLPYLQSDYAKIFYAHDNRLLQGEGRIIVVNQKSDMLAVGVATGENASSDKKSGPPAARGHFLSEKRRSIN